MFGKGRKWEIQGPLLMKLKHKYFDGINPCKSLPYDFHVELAGYIEDSKIHYTRGHKTNCPSFSDKEIVFHTHMDVLPTKDIITLPDMPSPVDMLVFLVSDNKKMYIKSARIFLTFEKSKSTKSISNKALTCIMENEKYWLDMVKKRQHDKMFYYLLHSLKKGMHKRNSTWNLSWKRITEQLLKIKVSIQSSNVKDPL